MGFLQKIKDMLGIGGVKMKLEVPAEISRKAKSVDGKIILTSKSDKHISNFKVQMKEVWKIGKGDDAETKEFELGEVELGEAFEMKAGETKELSFKLPFELIKSKNDELQEEGGVTGKLGSVGKFLDGEKSTFFIEADADVKGTVFGPTAVEEVKMTLK